MRSDPNPSTSQDSLLQLALKLSNLSLQSTESWTSGIDLEQQKLLQLIQERIQKCKTRDLSGAILETTESGVNTLYALVKAFAHIVSVKRLRVSGAQVPAYFNSLAPEKFDLMRDLSNKIKKIVWTVLQKLPKDILKTALFQRNTSDGCDALFVLMYALRGTCHVTAVRILMSVFKLDANPLLEALSLEKTIPGQPLAFFRAFLSSNLNEKIPEAFFDEKVSGFSFLMERIDLIVDQKIESKNDLATPSFVIFCLFIEVLAQSTVENAPENIKKMIFSRKSKLKAYIFEYLENIKPKRSSAELLAMVNPNNLFGALIDYQSGLVKSKETNMRFAVNRLIADKYALEQSEKETALAGKEENDFVDQFFSELNATAEQSGKTALKKAEVDSADPLFSQPNGTPSNAGFFRQAKPSQSQEHFDSWINEVGMELENEQIRSILDSLNVPMSPIAQAARSVSPTNEEPADVTKLAFS